MILSPLGAFLPELTIRSKLDFDEVEYLYTDLEGCKETQHETTHNFILKFVAEQRGPQRDPSAWISLAATARGKGN